MSVKFSEITDHSQRNAYVHQLLYDGPESNTFKSAQTISDEFKALDADSLIHLTMWVITSTASWKFSDFMANLPVIEFEKAFQLTHNELQVSAEQLRELDILWLTYNGAERYVYEDLPKEVREGYEARLAEFLGDDAAIDVIDSMEKAREVAFDLFSRRRTLGKSRSVSHLNHMLHVAEEADLATIQYVMHNVRQKQREYYKNHGFLKESSDYHPIPPHTVDPLNKREVEVIIVGGKQLIQSFTNEESNGAYFDDEFPGLRVILRKKDDPDFVQKALDSAQKHFDEAVILVASVAEKYLVPIASSNDFKLYPEALTSLNIRHTVNVPYSPACPLETKNLFAPNRQTNYLALYIGPDANPHKKTITRLINTPAKDFTLPILHHLHLDPPPENGWKTYAIGAMAIFGVFLAYKYVVRPNYPKLVEWWNARKTAAAN